MERIADLLQHLVLGVKLRKALLERVDLRLEVLVLLFECFEFCIGGREFDFERLKRCFEVGEVGVERVELRHEFGKVFFGLQGVLFDLVIELLEVRLQTAVVSAESLVQLFLLLDLLSKDFLFLL